MMAIGPPCRVQCARLAFAARKHFLVASQILSSVHDNLLSFKVLRPRWLLRDSDPHSS